MKRASVTTIDVAHPPLSSQAAEEALDELLRSARAGGPPRVVRVIHGYGSGGRGGVLKTAVRNWAYRRRDKILLVVPGEEYSPLESETANLLLETGLSLEDVGPGDPGVTILFLP